MLHIGTAKTFGPKFTKIQNVTGRKILPGNITSAFRPIGLPWHCHKMSGFAVINSRFLCKKFGKCGAPSWKDALQQECANSRLESSHLPRKKCQNQPPTKILPKSAEIRGGFVHFAKNGVFRNRARDLPTLSPNAPHWDRQNFWPQIHKNTECYRAKNFTR